LSGAGDARIPARRRQPTAGAVSRSDGSSGCAARRISGLAHGALQSEPEIGLLLPGNVALTQDGADVVVSAAPPKAMFEVASARPGLASVAREAEERVQAPSPRSDGVIASAR